MFYILLAVLLFFVIIFAFLLLYRKIIVKEYFPEVCNDKEYIKNIKNIQSECPNFNLTEFNSLSRNIFYMLINKCNSENILNLEQQKIPFILSFLDTHKNILNDISNIVDVKYIPSHFKKNKLYGNYAILSFDYNIQQVTRYDMPATFIFEDKKWKLYRYYYIDMDNKLEESDFITEYWVKVIKSNNPDFNYKKFKEEAEKFILNGQTCLSNNWNDKLQKYFTDTIINKTDKHLKMEEIEIEDFYIMNVTEKENLQYMSLRIKEELFMYTEKKPSKKESVVFKIILVMKDNKICFISKLEKQNIVL